MIAIISDKIGIQEKKSLENKMFNMINEVSIKK